MEICQGATVVKQLSIVCEGLPVHLNANHYLLKLKRGTTFVSCVYCARHLVLTIQHESIKTIPKAIRSVIADPSQDRREQQRKKTHKFLQNSHAFEMDDSERGRTNVGKHRINTGRSPLIRQTARLLPLAKRD